MRPLQVVQSEYWSTYNLVEESFEYPKCSLAVPIEWGFPFKLRCVEGPYNEGLDEREFQLVSSSLVVVDGHPVWEVEGDSVHVSVDLLQVVDLKASQGLVELIGRHVSGGEQLVALAAARERSETFQIWSSRVDRKKDLFRGVIAYECGRLFPRMVQWQGQIVDEEVRLFQVDGPDGTMMGVGVGLEVTEGSVVWTFPKGYWWDRLEFLAQPDVKEFKRLARALRKVKQIG
jgi:hypothetical protein